MPEYAEKIAAPPPDTSLVTDTPRVAETRWYQERQLARAIGREARAKQRLAAVLNNSLSTVGLRRHAFKTDEELDALELTQAQKLVVRAYEQSKRNVPFAIESADGHVKAAMRGMADKNGVTLNVENMTLNLPEKREPDQEAVVIDVDTTRE